MHKIPQQPLNRQKRLRGHIDSAQTLCRKAVQLGTMERRRTCRLCNSFETTDPAFQTLEEFFISVHFQDLSSVLLLETLQGRAHLSESSKHKILLGTGLTRGKCKRQSPVSRSEGLEISQVVLKNKDEILGHETGY